MLFVFFLVGVVLLTIPFETSERWKKERISLFSDPKLLRYGYIIRITVKTINIFFYRKKNLYIFLSYLLLFSLLINYQITIMFM